MASPSARGAFIGVESDGRKRSPVGRERQLREQRGRRLEPECEPESPLSFRQRRWRFRAARASSRTHSLAQYVDTFVDPVAAATFGSRYVFATLNQKEFSLQTRVNYVLSPKMSLQVYMQPLVSVGDYSGFKEFARPRTFEFTRYGSRPGRADLRPGREALHGGRPATAARPFGFDDPDFNFKSLRLNAIFRWEWRPGSAMYLVWTEQRQDLAHPGRVCASAATSAARSARRPTTC